MKLVDNQESIKSWMSSDLGQIRVFPLELHAMKTKTFSHRLAVGKMLSQANFREVEGVRKLRGHILACA